MIIYTHAKGVSISVVRGKPDRDRGSCYQQMSPFTLPPAAQTRRHAHARRPRGPVGKQPLPCSVAPVENGSFGKARCASSNE